MTKAIEGSRASDWCAHAVDTGYEIERERGRERKERGCMDTEGTRSVVIVTEREIHTRGSRW